VVSDVANVSNEDFGITAHQRTSASAHIRVQNTEGLDAAPASRKLCVPAPRRTATTANYVGEIVGVVLCIL
jgi:hypothetical protein